MLRLKRERLLRELSQHQVATMTRGLVGQPELSRIESGRTNPNDQELKELAKIFGVPPERLLDHVNECSLGEGAEYRDARKEVRT